MKLTFLAIALLAITITACGGPGGQALPVTEQENYEREIAGE